MREQNDIHFMRSALNLARRGLGRCAPNPSVGCVLVKEGHVIARARTGDGGRPHAEFLALQDIGQAAKGACAYVSLEPCAHVGETPSCADLLAEAGVSRVVVACGDPDTRTAGKGAAKLRDAGIEVVSGVLEEEAAFLNVGFFKVLSDKRPFITMKVATSADEKIAGGSKRWITGELARARGHLLRAQHDGILVGSGTVLADDPLLTTRLPEVEHEIKRFVLDRKGLVPRDKGFQIIDSPNLIEAVGKIAALGVTRLLIEGGAKVYSSFLEAGLVDQLAWFKAPHEIGGDGLSALPAGSLEDVVSGMNLEQEIQCGEDSLVIYRAKG